MPRLASPCDEGVPGRLVGRRSQRAASPSRGHPPAVVALRSCRPTGHRPSRAGVPAFLDRERAADARGGRGRARVGQLAVVAQLRTGVAHAGGVASRAMGDRGGPALLGGRGPDDAVLPAGRARDQARAGDGRPARPSTADRPGARRDRRHARAGAGVPRDHARDGGGRGLGHGDADRPGVRAGDPRAGVARVAAGGAPVPAHAGDRRRPADGRGGRAVLRGGSVGGLAPPRRPARGRDDRARAGARAAPRCRTWRSAR